MTQNLICCPRCYSTQITANRGGFSFGAGWLGALLLGPVGFLAGFFASDKIKITCLNCGCIFQPGDPSKKVGKVKPMPPTLRDALSKPHILRDVLSNKYRLTVSWIIFAIIGGLLIVLPILIAVIMIIVGAYVFISRQ